MRLKLVILALSLLATTALQAAITLPWDTPKPDTLPAYLDGSMMPYDFSACDPVPQWPDSLRPVFVAYVARHGARYLSGPKKVDELEENSRRTDESWGKSPARPRLSISIT